MKTIFLSTLAFCYFISFSQYKIKVKESKENIGNGNHNALVVTIFENSQKNVERAWKNEMKKTGAKISSSSEIFADNANIKQLGDNTVDIYAKSKKDDNNVIFIVGIDLGGAFLNSSKHPQKYKYFSNFLHNFALEQSKNGILILYNNEQKKQKILEKEYNALIKEKEKLEEAIKNYEEKIKDAKNKIEENIKKQELKNKEIEEQKKLLQEIENKLKSIK